MTGRRDVVFLGLAGLASFLFTLCFAFGTAALAETDELPHLSYAEVMAAGELPTIESPLVTAPDTVSGNFWPSVERNYYDPAHRTVWVANHPPGFYLLATPVIWLAHLFDAPTFGLLVLRVFVAACNASLVVVAGLLARELLPRIRPAVPLAAAVQLAMTALTFDGAAVYNDSLAGLLTSLSLLVAVRTLRRGLTHRGVTALAALCSAAALTRSTGLAMTAVCVGAVVGAWALHRRSTSFREGAVAIVVIGGMPALVAGWFYVRNWVLYGGPTASDYLVQRFERRRRTELSDMWLSYWGVQWERLFTQRRMGDAALSWNSISSVVGIVVLVGLAAFLLVVGVRGAASLIRRRPVPTDSAAVAVAWAATLVFVAITVVAIMQFLLAGANSHERYLLAVSPIIATVSAAGLLGALSRALNQRLLRALGSMFALFFLAWSVFLQLATVEWSNERALTLLYGPAGGFAAANVCLVGGIITVVAAAGSAVYTSLPHGGTAPSAAGRSIAAGSGSAASR